MFQRICIIVIPLKLDKLPTQLSQIQATMKLRLTKIPYSKVGNLDALNPSQFLLRDQKFTRSIILSDRQNIIVSKLLHKRECCKSPDIILTLPKAVLLLKTGRRDVRRKIPGRACRTRRLEFFEVFSKNRENTGFDPLERPPRRVFHLQSQA